MDGLIEQLSLQLLCPVLFSLHLFLPPLMLSIFRLFFGCSQIGEEKLEFSKLPPRNQRYTTERKDWVCSVWGFGSCSSISLEKVTCILSLFFSRQKLSFELPWRCTKFTRFCKRFSVSHAPTSFWWFNQRNSNFTKSLFTIWTFSFSQHQTCLVWERDY